MVVGEAQNAPGKVWDSARRLRNRKQLKQPRLSILRACSFSRLTTASPHQINHIFILDLFARKTRRPFSSTGEGQKLATLSAT